MEDKKKIAELKKGIKSEDVNTVLNTVKQIRKKGSTIIIPELISLLHTTSNNEIKKSITNLLDDLKDKKATAYIIEAINKKEYANIAHSLISSCWQSGLDYSNYLNIFVDLTIVSEYLIALEAFTVIENIQENINEEKITLAINKLKENITIEKNQEKQILLNELIKVIQNINSDKEEN